MVVDESEVVRGAIFQLPAKDTLPENAVLRITKSKYPMGDGIYNHPVVIASRPALEETKIHFHLITSYGTVPLDQMYNNEKDSHARKQLIRGHLPVYPNGPHPLIKESSSKSLKKDLPTLKLAYGKELRIEKSWVNIFDVYKMDFSLLQPYQREKDEEKVVYRLASHSLFQMRIICNLLRKYEPGEQWPKPASEAPVSQVGPGTYEEDFPALGS